MGISATPMTPTVGAWLALMEDNIDGDDDDVYSYYPAAPVLPRKEEEDLPFDEDPSPNDTIQQSTSDFWDRLVRGDVSVPPSPYRLDTPHWKSTSPNRSMNSPIYQQQQEPAKSFFDLLQCGNTYEYADIEKEISERIDIIADKVQSPCVKPPPTRYRHHTDIDSNRTRPDESVKSYETRIDVMTDDSSLVDMPSSLHHLDLKDDIPSLQKRSKDSQSNSKYRDLLDKAPQYEPPSVVLLPETRVLQQPVEEQSVIELDGNAKTKVSTSEPLLPRLEFSENLSPKLEGSTFLPESKQSQAELPAKTIFDIPALQSQYPRDSPCKTTQTAKTSEATQSHGSDIGFFNALVSPHPEILTHKAKKSEMYVLPFDSIIASTNEGNCEADDTIMKRISSLTADGDFRHEQTLQANKTLTTNPIYESSKICMPPLLVKKFHALKSIQLSKSLSISQSSQSIQILPKDRFAEYAAGDAENHHFIYEYGSEKHAYVAFFRRGVAATQCVRLYEHNTPAIFPTLSTELVVRVEASTVSTTDCQVRRGDFWGENSDNALNLPIVPGVAFVGTVYQHTTQKSNIRTGLSVGDRVLSLVHVGSNSRYLCITSDRVVKVPEELNDPCALACLPETYLTAFQSLHFGQKNGARYRKSSLLGKTILILGGATVTGRALIETAVAAGCAQVYATGKDKQFDTIRSCGGAPLGRDLCQWLSILAGKVDIIVGNDNSVGASELREEHTHLLARNGRVVILTAPDRDFSTVIELDELAEMTTNMGRKLIHYNVFDSWESDLKQGKRDMSHLMKLLLDGMIRPKILERIPLNRVAKAQDLLEGKKMNGFVVCEPWIIYRRKYEVLQGRDGDVYAESASKSDSHGKSITEDKNETNHILKTKEKDFTV